MKSRSTVAVAIILLSGIFVAAMWGIFREKEKPKAQVNEALVAAMEEDAGDGEEVSPEPEEAPPVRLRTDKRMKMREFIENARMLKARSRQMNGAEDRMPRFRIEPEPEAPAEQQEPVREADFEEALEAELMGVRSESTERLSPEQLEKVRKLRETVRSFSSGGRRVE